MEKFTDNYFIDVQRINFWQSDTNDKNPVDVHSITGEFYKQYFEDYMDLTSLFQLIILKFQKENSETDRFRNFAKLIIPGNRKRIAKNHIKNNISNITDTIFIELCAERRKFIINLLSKRNETDKFLRNYLKMKDIINLSYNNNEHQCVYEMKFCRKVNVIEKITNDGYEENTCYFKIPVVT
uniref:Uncharacterized protein n=1 Tax=Strongyloides venezuelensis TaxID=75913 RepID=A0A0K0FQL1_STRVS